MASFPKADGAKCGGTKKPLQRPGQANFSGRGKVSNVKGGKSKMKKSGKSGY